MNKEDLKVLVKQHFNLVDATEETLVKEEFANAILEDGTKITNDKDSEFAEGDKVFVEVDGEKKAAPSGDHITESGMVITLDDDSIITGMKRPDEAGEGSEGLAVEEEMSVAETEEKFEEEIEIEKEFEGDEPSLESIIEVIGEVIGEKMAVVEEKIIGIEEEMKSMKDKMAAFTNEPAEESVTTSNFSKAKPISNAADKRYHAMLSKINASKK